ncbi:MAG: hypothetical protein WCI28_12505, partial [Opitutaceae bacterium]
MPGLPAIKLNGRPNYGGTLDGTGAATPSDYTITINGSASLGHIIRRANAVSLPAVPSPPVSRGTRSLTLT